MKYILVLFGGCSTEYGVSLQSAHAVLTHMDPDRYTPVLVGITREGRWLHYAGPLDAIPQDRWQEAGTVPCTLDLDRGAKRLLLLDGSGRTVPFDAAFPVLHGKNGEDGTLQGLLELAGVPVIGCGCLASALCMDKARAHTLAAAAGIRVPAGAVFSRQAERGEVAGAAARLGYPAVRQARPGRLLLRHHPGGAAGGAAGGRGGGLSPRPGGAVGGGGARLRGGLRRAGQ